jgi:HlyD family secretion protein
MLVRNTMKSWVRILLVLAVLAAAVWILRATVFAPDPVPVRTVAVERGPVEETVTNSKAGTVEARRRAKLSPGTSGIVAEVRATRGQRVRHGEPLVRLADDTQRAQLVLAERALEVAQAESRRTCIAAERAERELKRNQELGVKGIVSADTIDGLSSVHDLAVAACEVAAASVEQGRAAVAVAQAELDKTVLRAPFDGIVAEVPVQLGEWATPSVPLVVAPDVVDVIDPASIYVAAPMDEVDSARLAPGLSARVTLDAFPGRSFPGRVALIAPYVLDVESQNRTVEIEVVLDDTEFGARLLPGTSADVEVILDVRPSTLRVPTGVLLEGGRVLVIEDGVLVERRVETGLRNWDWTEILSGLAEGDPVVASLDRAEVRAGAEVVVQAEP